MTIFAVAMTGILALLHSTISNSLVSRHEIVAANLAREQVELIKNIRNTNVRNYTDWDRARISDDGNAFFTGGVFIIENSYSNSWTSYGQNGEISESPVKMSSWSFAVADTLEQKFNTTRLYLDSEGRYTHTSANNTGTIYASYVIISRLRFDTINGPIEPKNTNDKPQGYVIDARVIVKSRWYTEYEVKTILTDWQK